ncbi:hypothetical protein DYH09_25795, partial [bacterium CPR1]|nr:hypothetical protein [bacterium CPR1]
MMTQNPFPSPMDSNGYQRLSGTCSEQAMLRLVTGNLVKTVSLVDVATIGPPLRLFLTYNAQEATTSNELGRVKWRHNYMMKLLISGSPATQITFVSDSGRHYHFKLDGSVWKLDQFDGSGNLNTYFDDFQLTADSTDWKLTFFPEKTFYKFDSSGQLIRIEDQHGNAVTFTYSSGKLVTVTEAAQGVSSGRTITLAYSTSGGYDGSFLTSVTDPKGNVISLTYDTTDRDLEQIAWGTGCVVKYVYNADHRITKRVEAKYIGQDPELGYSYAYDSSGRLTSVTDPEDNQLTYSYTPDDNVDKELLSGSSASDSKTMSQLGFKQTKLTDARGKVWKFRFDQAGSPWRILHPNNRWTHTYTDNNQVEIFRNDGYPNPVSSFVGPQVNPKNRSFRRITDSYGSPLYECSPSGLVSQMTYDSDRHLTSVHQGQAHFGVQGLFFPEFGREGYLLCAFNSTSSDVWKKPSYVSSITEPDSADFQRAAASQTNSLADPRSLSAIPAVAGSLPTGLQRGYGRWETKSTGSSAVFDFAVNIESSAGTKEFNLSIYTSSVDHGLYASYPMLYNNQFGRDLEIEVSDLNGTQTFRVYNNAPGVWVSFPVKGSSASPIQVTVRAKGETVTQSGRAVISAIAFDEKASRLTSYTYTNGNLTAIKDRLGNTTTLSYNADGTLSSVTDPQSRVTSFSYEDAYKNLTRILDPGGGVTLMEHDLNGNVTRVIDPECHEQQMSYDEKNRILKVVDGLGNIQSFSYDDNGNLEEVVDAAGRVTTMLYSPANRLVEVRDPLHGAGAPTLLEYDESGLLTSVTDPRGEETLLTYDEVGQLTDIEQPDTQKVNLGLDIWGRVVAVNPPNANLAALDDVNLEGAANRLRNADASQADPARIDNFPRYWSTSLARDMTDGHDAAPSLQFSLTSSWAQISQNRLDLPVGSQYVARAWARKKSSPFTQTGTVRLRARVRDEFSNETYLPTTTVDHTLSAYPDWSQMDWMRFQVPGDSQFGLFTTDLVLEGHCSTAKIGCADDFELYQLGIAYLYNANDQLTQIRTPDGAVTRLNRDRFGRVIAWVDPIGRETLLQYDTMDRVTKIFDPLGNTVEFSYNSVGNLTSFIDARGKQTQYEYDALDRLVEITYPDSSTELFSYYKNGQLKSYTDNQSRTRNFFYDAAGRLVQVTYSDGQTVTFDLDKVGNVRQRKERNGDLVLFQYDALNRVIGETRTVAGANTTPSWAIQQTYDENGNRTALKTEVPSGASIYGPATGAAIYGPTTGAGTYLALNPLWSTPSDGYDAMNRLAKFKDRNDQQTLLSYDPDGRRTKITHPLPSSTPVQTSASYDILGRLTRLKTTLGTDSTPTDDANGLFMSRYGYDLASQRVAQISHIEGDFDNLVYGLDASGRLIEACVNRFVERRKEHFREGTLTHVHLDGDKVRLTPFEDTFAGSSLDSDRWRLIYQPTYAIDTVDYIGMQALQNEGLHFAFPRGFSDIIRIRPQDNAVENKLPRFGIVSNQPWAVAEHERVLSGDFDVQVEFTDLQLVGTDSIAGLRVQVNRLPLDDSDVTGLGGKRALICRHHAGASNNYRARIWNSGTPSLNATGGSADEKGRFRLQRAGSTLTLYYDSNSSGSWTQLGQDTGFGTSDLYLYLYFRCYGNLGSVRFQDFKRVSGASDPTTYGSSGTYESVVYDAGRSVSWNTISWTETLPGGGADVEFQVALSSSPDGPWTYQGPLGSTSNKFTTPGGESILDSGSSARTGRYARYKAFLTAGSSGTLTPDFTKVQLSHSGTSTS